MERPGLLSATGVCVLILLPKGAQADDAPDPHLTPGLIASADVGAVCASGGRPGSAYSRAHRSMNENDRRADFARYRIAWRAIFTPPAAKEGTEKAAGLLFWSYNPGLVRRVAKAADRPAGSAWRCRPHGAR